MKGLGKIKKILIMLAVLTVLLCPYGAAEATLIFLDFESPNFSPDSSAGDYNHTYNTAFGNIYFNGRIWNQLRGDPLEDHTTGEGYFLKNTREEDTLNISFDFPVYSFDGFAYSIPRFDYTIEAYNLNDELVYTDTSAGRRRWREGSLDFSSDPISKLTFYSDGNGNNFALDDLTFETFQAPVPEPASLFLLGSGLLALQKKKRKFVQI